MDEQTDDVQSDPYVAFSFTGGTKMCKTEQATRDKMLKLDNAEIYNSKLCGTFYTENNKVLHHTYLSQSCPVYSGLHRHRPDPSSHSPVETLRSQTQATTVQIWIT